MNRKEWSPHGLLWGPTPSTGYPVPTAERRSKARKAKLGKWTKTTETVRIGKSSHDHPQMVVGSLAAPDGRFGERDPGDYCRDGRRRLL